VRVESRRGPEHLKAIFRWSAPPARQPYDDSYAAGLFNAHHDCDMPIRDRSSMTRLKR